MALSTTKAEYITSNNGAKHMMWIHQLFSDIGLDISKPAPMFCENITVITISKDSSYHTRTKHIIIFEKTWLQTKLRSTMWCQMTTLLTYSQRCSILLNTINWWVYLEWENCFIKRVCHWYYRSKETKHHWMSKYAYWSTILQHLLHTVAQKTVPMFCFLRKISV